MIAKLGDVWLVDMGIAGRIRPAVVVLDDRVEVERALIVHVPVTSQNCGTVSEVPLGHLRFLRHESTANIQGKGSLRKTRFERKLGGLPPDDLEKIRLAMRAAFGL